MENEVNNNVEINNPVEAPVETAGVKVVETDAGNKDGQNKCEKCGATDISLNTKTGLLRCNYCRHEFNAQKVEGLEEDVTKLEGEVIGSGATNIVADTNEMITLKCTSCGAEVIIDTSNATQARCHWCRNTLSINEQIPNGAVPDMVLPFKISKEEAKASIEEFVKKRSFFANPIFKKEFTTENIMGVYLPYMLVDINGHSTLKGEGEIKIREYTVGSDENKTTYYDADAYQVERDFDIFINDLTVESSQDKLNHKSNDKTNNIINAIMPFDTDNCVKWDSNYIKGYTSEKRDVNIDSLRDYIQTQAKDVARFQANSTLKQYNRGVRWDYENLSIKGQQWSAAYLPVWLYSYQQVKGDKKLLHYVAVNARTKETMGSVPIHMPKLITYSAIVELLGFIAMFLVDWDYSFIFLSLGVIFYFIFYSKYRNQNARHTHESETDTKIDNITESDEFIQTKKRLRNSMIEGANNHSVSNGNFLDMFKNK